MIHDPWIDFQPPRWHLVCLVSKRYLHSESSVTTHYGFFLTWSRLPTPTSLPPRYPLGPNVRLPFFVGPSSCVYPFGSNEGTRPPRTSRRHTALRGFLYVDPPERGVRVSESSSWVRLACRTPRRGPGPETSEVVVAKFRLWTRRIAQGSKTTGFSSVDGGGRVETPPRGFSVVGTTFYPNLKTHLQLGTDPVHTCPFPGHRPP